MDGLTVPGIVFEGRVLREFRTSDAASFSEVFDCSFGAGANGFECNTGLAP